MKHDIVISSERVTGIWSEPLENEVSHCMLFEECVIGNGTAVVFERQVNQ